MLYIDKKEYKYEKALTLKRSNELTNSQWPADVFAQISYEITLKSPEGEIDIYDSGNDLFPKIILVNEAI